MNDRTTYFGGIEQDSARHLLRKQDERRTNPGASLRHLCNIWPLTGGLRGRPGLDVKVHFGDSYLIWPDMLGNWRPYVGKTWNFSAGQINPGMDDDTKDWNLFDPPAKPDGSWSSKYQEDTWRYSNIASAINQRYALFGFPAAGCPLNIPDADITYVEINLARAAIYGMLTRFVQEKVDPFTGIFHYASMYELLSDARVGDIPPGGAAEDRAWTNVTRDPHRDGMRWDWAEYRMEMISTDVRCDNDFLELERVLRLMICNQPAVADNMAGSTGWIRDRLSHPSREEAWSQPGTQFYEGELQNIFGYCISSYAGGLRCDLAAQPGYANPTFTCANMSTMYQKEVSFYVWAKDTSGGSIDGLPTAWYDWFGKAPELGKFAFMYTSPINKDAAVVYSFKFSRPSLVPFPLDNTWYVCDYREQAVAVAKWTFPADRYLGLHITREQNESPTWHRGRKVFDSTKEWR